MKAVILSGGEGTRVRPLTYDTPKPLVPIIERPIISYLFDLLKIHGFNEVIITVSYKADKIEEHYQNGYAYGIHIAYSLEGTVENGELFPQALGSAGGLKKVQNFAHFFDESFLVICGDALIDLDLTKAMAFHKAHSQLATVVTKEIPHEEVYRYGVVVADKECKIKSFQEKPTLKEAKSNLINTGIYIFEPEIFDWIPDKQKYDIGGELLPNLVANNIDIYAYTPPFQWVDVGTTKDFFHANMKVVLGQLENIKPYGKEVMPNVWMGINCNIDFDAIEIVPPVYIGNSVTIKKGAKILGPLIIGSGSLIEEQVYLKNCIVHHYTKINKNLTFNDTIITSQYIINPYHGAYVDLKKVKLDFLIHDTRQGPRQLSDFKRELKNAIECLHDLTEM
ncbi:MAG: NDP-sugar synthase [Campylobacterales bacterium]|nr:NDP-sugar synthase [Campylobacterales bacterium]